MRMENQKCDDCGLVCQKTPVGLCVILCHENKIICMSCNRTRLDYQKLLWKHTTICKYLKRRRRGEKNISKDLENKL